MIHQCAVRSNPCKSIVGGLCVVWIQGMSVEVMLFEVSSRKHKITKKIHIFKAYEPIIFCRSSFLATTVLHLSWTWQYCDRKCFIEIFVISRYLLWRKCHRLECTELIILLKIHPIWWKWMEIFVAFFPFFFFMSIALFSTGHQPKTVKWLWTQGQNVYLWLGGLSPY